MLDPARPVDSSLYDLGKGLRQTGKDMLGIQAFEDAKLSFSKGKYVTGALQGLQGIGAVGLNIVAPMISPARSVGVTQGIQIGTKVQGSQMNAYSVVFETTIAKTGVGTREGHKAAANANLAAALADKDTVKALSALSVSPAKGTGTPLGFNWHHAKDRPGTMQLVTDVQHKPGSAFQNALHPNGLGGFAQWGRGW